MRCGNCLTNQGESSRMYPARQTRSTLCACSAATTSRSCAWRSLPLDGITRVSSPSPFAVAMPPASERFEITIAMRALAIFPDATFLAIASKFDPRPDNNIPSCFMPLQTNCLIFCGQLTANLKLQTFFRQFTVAGGICLDESYAHWCDALALSTLEAGLGTTTTVDRFGEFASSTGRTRAAKVASGKADRYRTVAASSRCTAGVRSDQSEEPAAAFVEREVPPLLQIGIRSRGICSDWSRGGHQPGAGFVPQLWSGRVRLWQAL